MARPLLIDCDPGCDDAVALLAALGSDALDVRGVTTVAGNTTVDNATANARAVLELAGRPDLPVAAGCDRPLVHALKTAEHVHGPGGIRGDLPAGDAEPVDRHAAEFIVDRARATDGLALVAVGPLTNVAVGLALEPALPELLDEVVVMGGAAFGPGNRTPTAEANFYTDPVAARRVVAATAPRIAGLDVTREATLPPGDRGRFEVADDRLAGALSEWLDYYPDSIREARGYPASPQHDAVAVAAAAGEAVAFDRYPVDVVAEGGRCRGALIPDGQGDAGFDLRADLAVDLDVDRFRNFLVNALDAVA